MLTDFTKKICCCNFKEVIMPEETNYLLTDEFMAFSIKIKEIYEKKKAKKQELKEFYDKIQVDLKALDSQAKELEDEFQAWKKVQEKQDE